MYIRSLTLVMMLAALSACSSSQPQTANLASAESVQWDVITAPTSLSRVYNSNLVQMR